MAVRRGCIRVLKIVSQLCQLFLGLGLMLLGLAEFSMEPPLFDILGENGSRPALPEGAFKLPTGTTNHHIFGRVMDLPVLCLFLAYFMALIWLKFRGYLSWIMTSCMLCALFLIVAVNRGLASSVLEWKFMTQRAWIISLDVLILSFGWTAVVMVLLIVRDWFPFKTMKGPAVTTAERAVLILANIVGLYAVLTLCFFIWFTRLYVSWACITSSYDVLLLCQLTNQIQCYQCNNQTADHCVDASLAECVKNPQLGEPFHCLSPIYTIDNPYGFCVFNYNIGFFTFVTVFAYVGGIYFFCRTIFKALFKCVKVVVLISVKYCLRLVQKAQSTIEENSLNISKDRISLLASLPKDYASTNSTKQ